MTRNTPFQLITATFSPFDTNGKLNPSVIPGYARYLIANGITAAFVNGSTGESLSLTVDERLALASKWVQETTDSFRIIVHVGDNCINNAITMARHAQEIGCAAISAMAPTFFRPSNAEELIRFLEPIAAAAPETDFYYYHIPSMTHVELPMDEFLSKAAPRIPTLAGVKYTHYDLTELQQCQARWGDRYPLFFGRDEMILPALTVGIGGAVGTIYNFIPKTYGRLIEAYRNKRMEEAAELFDVANRFIGLLHRHGVLSTGKLLMSRLGIDCGAVRLPLSPSSESRLESLVKSSRELPLLDSWARGSVPPKMHIDLKRAPATGSTSTSRLDSPV